MKVSSLLQHCLVASGLVLAAGAASATTVYSTDSFTNASGSNMGAAVAGANGWYFNNVRAGGTAAVSTAHAQSGDGSVSMSGPNNAKADIEYLPNAVAIGGNYNSTASLGLLSTLSSMSYDWYRDSSSTANADQHASLRVLPKASPRPRILLVSAPAFHSSFDWPLPRSLSIHGIRLPASGAPNCLISSGE